jgi:sulfur relay (sulfurtransferase) DsrF/TusC family protein
MGNICIILRRPPYGSVDASEAIRHCLGGITEDMSVKLVLVDGGVNTAKKGQNTEATEYLNMESGIIDCIDMGAEVYSDKASMEEERLKNGDLAEGVRIANSSEIANIISNSDTTLIF